MSLNCSVTPSSFNAGESPRLGAKGGTGIFSPILVSESSDSVDNVPTHQTTIQSYGLEFD